VSQVVSRPTPTIVTCDAGHKAVSFDTGAPNCAVLGYEELVPLSPSEEHLPLAVPDGAAAPERGELIALVPMHVCPTVNLYDEAVLVEDGRVVGLEAIAARGHPGPLLGQMS